MGKTAAVASFIRRIVSWPRQSMKLKGSQTRTWQKDLKPRDFAKGDKPRSLSRGVGFPGNTKQLDSIFPSTATAEHLHVSGAHLQISLFGTANQLKKMTSILLKKFSHEIVESRETLADLGFADRCQGQHRRQKFVTRKDSAWASGLATQLGQLV